MELAVYWDVSAAGAVIDVEDFVSPVDGVDVEVRDFVEKEAGVEDKLDYGKVSRVFDGLEEGGDFGVS